jgi:hypothetical protein
MPLGGMPAAAEDADMAADAAHFFVHLAPRCERLLAIGNVTLERRTVGDLRDLRGGVGGAHLRRGRLLSERVVNRNNAEYGNQ